MHAQRRRRDRELRLRRAPRVVGRDRLARLAVGGALTANDDCEATFSGNTHGAEVPAEHLENDVRNRCGLAPADPDWLPSQVPEPWAPEMEVRMKNMFINKKYNA